MRPGPRPKIDSAVLSDLREAIKRCVKVRLHYRARGSKQLSRQIVCPYGFLYGNRHYLIAFSMSLQVRDYRPYSLSNIEKIVVTDFPFERREDFSLQAYAEQSFGVFREGDRDEPFDVVWKVDAEVADDARNFLFHPTQTIEEQPDGSLIIRFRAYGLKEMARHLFTWGGYIEIVEPKELRDCFAEILTDAAASIPKAKRRSSNRP